MYIFFFLINLTFSLLFYFFLHLIPETIIFFIIGLIMLFYFSPIYFGKKKQGTGIISKMKVSADTFKRTIPLLQKVSYLIAFLFFYLSLYGISKSFEGATSIFGIPKKPKEELFPIFTIITSATILFVYLLTIRKQKTVVNLIHRSNHLIVSFIYFIISIKKLVFHGSIDPIFITNTVVSFLGLMFVLTTDATIEKIRKNLYFVYTASFFYLLNILYIRIYFTTPYQYLFGYSLFIYSILFFEFISKIPFLRTYDVHSKYFGILMNYLAWGIASIYLFLEGNFWHFVLILFGAVIFNIMVHQRYRNYVSFAIMLISLCLLYVKAFLPIYRTDPIFYMLFIFTLPSLFIGYTYLFRQRYSLDNYTIHGFAILFSIVSMSLYFVFYPYQILFVSVLMMLESFILFGSFAKLRSK